MLNCLKCRHYPKPWLIREVVRTGDIELARSAPTLATVTGLSCHGLVDLVTRLPSSRSQIQFNTGIIQNCVIALMVSDSCDTASTHGYR